MKKRVAIILILCLLAVLFVACTAKNLTVRDDIKKKADYYIQQGVTLVARGDFEKARDQFELALASASSIDDIPRTISALINLAEVNIRLTQYSVASDEIEWAEQLAKTENLKEFFCRLEIIWGRFYDAIGRQDDAAVHYQTAIKLALNDTEKAQALNNLAVIRIRQGTFPEALKLLDEAFSINTRLALYDQLGNNEYNYGMLYFAQGKFSTALPHFSTALTWDRKSETIFGVLEDLKMIARCWEKLGDKDKALYFWQRALSTAKSIDKSQVKAIQAAIDALTNPAPADSSQGTTSGNSGSNG